MSSYRQIFKSTAIVGGAQVLKLAVTVVQTKALALLLGKTGTGLAGNYQSAVNLMVSLTGFGIGNSGVRQIAEAVSTQDEKQVAITVKTLRITAWITGILGLLLMLVCCQSLSRRYFHSVEHSGEMALVSLVILFTNIASGQAALLTGMRKMKDLAACQVSGAVFGAVTSITLIYFMRERGVAWYLVVASAFAVLPSWWLARKIRLPQIRLAARDIARNALQLCGLGSAFMISSLLNNGVDLVIRGLVTGRYGDGGAGLYTAVYTISFYFVYMVLQAMGTDFYPRLTGVVKDHEATNRMVNEQTEIGVLIALPGALATLALAPWILYVFYSSEFMAGSEIVRWQTMGVVFRVICWPMGFILLAKGLSLLFIVTELSFSGLQIALVYLCANKWGLEGVGIAFMLTNIVLTAYLLVISRWITGFRWSRQSLSLILSACFLLFLTQATVILLPLLPGTIAALIIAGIAAAGCMRFLQRVLNVNIRDLGPWKRVAQAFGSKAK